MPVIEWVKQRAQEIPVQEPKVGVRQLQRRSAVWNRGRTVTILYYVLYALVIACVAEDHHIMYNNNVIISGNGSVV